MLSITKKQPSAEKAAAFRAWHPDFRQLATLPDTKVIRTSFYINAVAGAILAVLLTAVGYQEYQIATANAQIESDTADLVKLKKSNDSLVGLFNQFKAHEKKIIEVDGFLNKGRLPFVDLLANLHDSLDAGMAITLVDASAQGVLYKGFAQGSTEQATAVVSAYGKKMAAYEVFKGKYEKISVTKVTPEKAVAGVMFELGMKAVVAAPGKK